VALLVVAVAAESQNRYLLFPMESSP